MLFVLEATKCEGVGRVVVRLIEVVLLEREDEVEAGVVGDGSWGFVSMGS
jgi:hypothetical protein